jgi:hypothetical protein
MAILSFAELDLFMSVHTTQRELAIAANLTLLDYLPTDTCSIVNGHCTVVFEVIRTHLRGMFLKKSGMFLEKGVDAMRRSQKRDPLSRYNMAFRLNIHCILQGERERSQSVQSVPTPFFKNIPLFFKNIPRATATMSDRDVDKRLDWSSSPWVPAIARANLGWVCERLTAVTGGLEFGRKVRFFVSLASLARGKKRTGPPGRGLGGCRGKGVETFVHCRCRKHAVQLQHPLSRCTYMHGNFKLC